MTMITHHLQQDIISRLSTAPSLRFSQLKPANIESNLFMYHLKQLIREGYVEKVEHGYKLASNGLTYVDTLSLVSNKPRKQPKIISIIAIKNSQGEWLLGRRKLQPYVGELAFPSGKQHFGESPETHVQRELFEKTGLTVPLIRRGLADIRIYCEGDILTHIVGHVYVGAIKEKEDIAESKQYRYEWHKDIPEEERLMPGTVELAKAITGRTIPFFLSLDVEYMPDNK